MLLTLYYIFFQLILFSQINFAFHKQYLDDFQTFSLQMIQIHNYADLKFVLNTLKKKKLFVP